MVYPALLPLMRTPQLPAVDWTDSPTNLNGLARFGERWNLVSACVPSGFKRATLHECVWSASHYTCFTLAENAQVPTEQEARWARDLVWKLCRSGKSPDPVKCAYWLHRWYKSCSSFSFLFNCTAFLNNRSEKHKSTSPGAIQVRNWWKAIGTEEELNAISQLKKGWMKCYIYCNVKLAHSSILTVCDNAGRIKERAWYGKEVFV